MILRRLRAIVMLAGLWSAVWAVAGIPYIAILYALRQPFLRPSFLRWAIDLVPQFAWTGAFAGAVFAIVFMAAERNRRIEEMSGKRVALWGFLGGIAFPAIMIVPYMVSEGLATSGLLWGVFGLTGLLGSACAVGSLALARKAPAPTPASEPAESGA